ncbi:MAG: hypothetical protein GX601_02640, partial [Anaerolineales bacterium]|nr:hypothetical protein [Anaerolineales bacterium]
MSARAAARPAASGPAAHSWARLALPCLVVLLAFVLRVIDLPTVPFGWHPDEATKGLLARDVLAGKYHPAFFTAFTGRDALYVYLEAAAFALFGEGVLAGRLLSAFVGTLTVAATYALGRAMGSHRVGLLASSLLAASLWHLIASRNGYRAVIQPLVQAPVLWVLFAEWRSDEVRRGSWLRFAAAGAALGLTQYTYTAARAFPLLVAALLVVAALAAPARVANRKRQIALMLATALIVVLPLAVYFARHPSDLVGRAAQIAVFTPAWSGGRPWERLGRSVVETLRMFSFWGDPNYRFNVAGQPVFGLPDGILFYAGLLACLWQAIRSRRHARIIGAALLLWLLIMLLPMTLSAEGLPYYQRAIGILPGIYLIAALGLDTAARWPSTLRRPAARNVAARIVAIAVTALVGWLFVRVWQDYFVAWHTNPRNDDDRRVAMVYAADYLQREPATGELYLSTAYARHPTLAFLA